MKDSNNHNESENLAEAFSDLMHKSEHISEDTDSSDTQKNTSNILKLVSIMLIIGMLFAFGILAYKTLQSADTPAKDSSSSTDVLGSVTTFKPYYPDENLLPEGMSLAKSNISYNSEVLLIPLNTANNQAVSISQQTIPDEFSNALPIAGETIETSYGKGAISSLDGRTTINIITDDGVFMLISAPSTVGTDSLKQLAQSLRN